MLLPGTGKRQASVLHGSLQQKALRTTEEPENNHMEVSSSGQVSVSSEVVPSGMSKRSIHTNGPVNKSGSVQDGHLSRCQETAVSPPNGNMISAEKSFTIDHTHGVSRSAGAIDSNSATSSESKHLHLRGSNAHSSGVDKQIDVTVLRDISLSKNDRRFLSRWRLHSAPQNVTRSAMRSASRAKCAVSQPMKKEYELPLGLQTRPSRMSCSIRQPNISLPSQKCTTSWDMEFQPAKGETQHSMSPLSIGSSTFTTNVSLNSFQCLQTAWFYQNKPKVGLVQPLRGYCCPAVQSGREERMPRGEINAENSSTFHIMQSSDLPEGI
eukprot:gb/GECG01010398.1/.p1 GENE.gb/GECG01010398.1/~~gb/GECG01010398.1/.p1  ORF type:complete len:324 (+),score=33.60 gb/GECG01010398.1/:1-972(+)